MAKKMGAGSSTEKRIERAEKTGVFALRDQGLPELPLKIFSLKTLRTLDVGNNKLLKLPDAVSRCTMLITLSVDGWLNVSVSPARAVPTLLELRRRISSLLSRLIERAAK